MKSNLKILLVRFSSIGDIILTTPLVRALRKALPDAQIDFLTKKQYADLYRHNPHLSNLLEYDSSQKNGLQQIKQQIQAEHYDILLDIHRNLRTLNLRLNSKAKQVGTYSKQLLKRELLVNLGINKYREIKPVFLRYFESVEKLNVQYDGGGSDVFLGESDSFAVKNSLRLQGWKPNQTIVTLCPGAKHKNKQWFPERFIEVANYAAKEWGAYIVLLGGPGEEVLCKDMLGKIVGQKANYAGKLSLLGSAALLQLSNVVVTNDTGMMHLAQSQQTPIVAIFGPTTKELGFYPFDKDSIVLEQEVACRPCTHTGMAHCPKKHFACMEGITATMVTKAIDKLL